MVVGVDIDLVQNHVVVDFKLDLAIATILFQRMVVGHVLVHQYKDDAATLIIVQVISSYSRCIIQLINTSNKIWLVMVIHVDLCNWRIGREIYPYVRQ